MAALPRSDVPGVGVGRRYQRDTRSGTGPRRDLRGCHLLREEPPEGYCHVKY